MVGFLMVLQQKQQTSPGIRIDTIKFHWEFEFNEPVWFMCISILRAKKHKCLWQKHPTKHLIDQVQTKIKGNSISGFNSSPTRPPPKKTEDLMSKKSHVDCHWLKLQCSPLRWQPTKSTPHIHLEGILGGLQRFCLKNQPRFMTLKA